MLRRFVVLAVAAIAVLSVSETATAANCLRSYDSTPTVLSVGAPVGAAASGSSSSVGTVSFGGKKYFTNRIPANTKVNLVNPTTPQASIDQLLTSATSSRVIRFGPGAYTLQTIKVTKSNTRIEVDPDATFTMTSTSDYVFVVHPDKGGATLTNIEIGCSNPSKRFTINVQGVPKTGQRRAIILGDVRNFEDDE